MVDDYLANKKHVVLFRSRSGDILIGTDNLADLTRQDWFREFLNLSQLREDSRYEAKKPQQPQQSQPEVQVPKEKFIVNFMDIGPDEMTQQVWGSQSVEAQNRWMAKWSQG